MKYRAMIFDMDGTIVNTENIWHRATLEVLKSHNIILSIKQEQELIHDTIGLSSLEFCRFLKVNIPYPESLESLIEQLTQSAAQLYEKHAHFIDGFLPFFDKVRTYNLRVGIATNACDTTLGITKKRLGLEKL